MRKISILFFVFIFLFGCREEISHVKKIEIKIEEAEVAEEVIKKEYLKEDTLKYLIKESNKITNVIEIETLHDMIIDNLLIEVKHNDSIDEQEEIIGDVVRDILEKWKHGVVKGVVEDNDIILNDDDFETILARTSVENAINVMTSYEIIYLRNQVD